jgi:SulP family sulfate permease
VNGRQLYLCSLKGEVGAVMQRGGCGKRLGQGNIFETKTDAIARIVPRLDPHRCAVCTVRIFRECALMPGGEAAAP